MSNRPLEFRIGQLEASVEHLNGGFEQIDKRLGDLRSDVVSGFARVDQRFESFELRFESLDRKFESKFDRLDGKIDRNFKTLATWMLGQTGIILGALAAVAFTLRH